MNHPDFPFADIAIGGPSNRNNVVRISDIPGLLPERPEDCHHTVHRFPQAYLDHFQENGRNSVKGYKGPSYADGLPFDIDRKDDLSGALKDTIRLLTRLYVDYEVPQHPVRVWFSGSKGFHVCLPSGLFGPWLPSVDLAGHVGGVAECMSGDTIIDNIYDRNRLFRISNTINSKTGLYKIPILPAELPTMTIKDILERAKKPCYVEWPSWEGVVPVASCVGAYEAAQAHKKGKQSASFPVGEIFRTDLRDGQGRHQHGFRLACKLRDWNLPKGAARELLSWWNDRLPVSLTGTDGNDELNRIIENAYGEEDNEDRITEAVIRSVFDLADDYQAYIHALKERKIKLGFPSLDTLMRGIAPGEVCTVLAKTGTGKTAFALNVLRNLSRFQGVHSMMCSMEQPKAQVFERLSQMTLGVRGADIEKEWDNEQFSARVITELSQQLGERVWTCDLPSLTLDEIERVVRLAERRAGTPLSLLAIDYLGLLDTKALDRSLYGRVSEAARSMKSLAKRLDIAVLVLCQVHRSEDDHGQKPLSLSSARESGAIEESADFVLGLYRPNIMGEAGKPDDEIVLQLLKNRKGRTGKLPCVWDGRSLRIWEPERHQEDEDQYCAALGH